MHRLFLLCTVLLFVQLFGWTYCAAVETPYDAHSVVIRFEQGSAPAEAWIAAGRSGSIPELIRFLGPHTSHGYISDATLTAVYQAQNRRKVDALVQASIRPLPYIAVVEFQADMDPLLVARKLSSLHYVVYAEPAYHYQIIAAPNDPLATSQYHLGKIKAPEAWDLLPASAPVLVGIVDTGIDTLHPDLNQNIWRNPGETGRDGKGLDKRTNGVDDDENGFIDDWIGWDFVGANDDKADNMPLPGHPHGTHVGGIVAAVVDNNIGVAGVARNVKVVPIKVGLDSPSARSVLKTSEGILYAAAIGCDVINCSFGSSSASFADLDVVSVATGLGSLIVAASGNDGLDRAFYPAAHPPVLSVAATDADDSRAFFSNIHATVDVSAPGYNILSTISGNGYDYYDGTSMASPIVAAVAAMTKLMDPSLTPTALRALVKANADNIDLFTQSFVGRMGSGRVNALRAVQRENTRYAELTSYTLTDQDGDGVLAAGEEITINIQVTNLLRPLNNARVVLTPAPSNFLPILEIDATDLGAMRTYERKGGDQPMQMTLPTDAPLNAQLALIATIYEADTVVGRDLITATINPSYRTMRDNDLTFSVNSVGNIGYNDYPDNEQGVGFSYAESTSLLYEGGFMVGRSPTYLPNVLRGSVASFRDNSFAPKQVVEIRRDSVPNGARSVAVFDDSNDSYGLGLQYRQTIYQPTSDSLRTSTLIVYRITNPADTAVSDLFGGLFFDWDTSPFGADDGVAWDHANGVMIHQNARRTDIPTITCSLLSPMNVNVYAIDNGGIGSVNIYNGFQRSEKWASISGGIGRRNSSITDVSMVITGGPFTLLPGETRELAFALTFGSDLADATARNASARLAAMEMGIDAVPYSPQPLTDAIVALSGGGVQMPGTADVTVMLQNTTTVVMDVIDLQGRSLGRVFEEAGIPAGTHVRQILIPAAATGVYLLRMTTGSGESILPIQILP